MNLLKSAVFSTALAFTPLAANATIFNFSYTFGDSTVLTGSLSGTLNASNFVDNISNVHVFFNGTEFSGEPLFHAAWNTVTHAFDNTIAALVSPNAALNNFIFADTNVPTDNNATNFFEFLNDANPLIGGQEVFAENLNTGDIDLDGPSNVSSGSWSLTAQAPEPATFALVIAGLGLIAAGTRRGRQG